MCKSCDTETKRLELHFHSSYSNIRLLDAITDIEESILKAAELGLGGMALTEHECVASHVKGIQIVRKLKKDNKIPQDFTLVLGNEIYLVESIEETRDNYQSGVTKFPHYLLLSKNREGHEALRILSSQAWENSFYTGTMERVPTSKENLEDIVKKYPNTLIASSACLGSESSIHILGYEAAKLEDNKEMMIYHNNRLYDFIEWNINLHGRDNFFLELQPSKGYEQSTVNKKLIEISKEYDLKMIITNDVHYLRPEDAPIHEAYLNSKEGDREVASFYSDTYLHKNEEIFDKLDYIDHDIIVEALNNTVLIGSMIEDYTIEADTVIPVTKLPEFEVTHLFKGGYKKYGYISKMAHSENEQDRYLIHLIEKGFKEKIPYKTMNKDEFHEVMARIDIELEELWEMSKVLNQPMASYYVTVAKLIQLIWADDCGDESRQVGSLVGAGRGSAVAFLINYLLGITQINPMNYGIHVPHWRHLHKSKPDISALDIDIDVTSTKKGYVYDRMREFFGKHNVIQVSTFGKEKSKSALQTACRGLKIDSDVGLYLASFVPVERGNMWTLKDCIYGNKEEGRDPVKQLVKELEQYPRLCETALKIEGLINKRSIHAGGVLVLNQDYTKMNAMMRAPNGTPVTQFNLDDSQAMGGIKFDVLVVEANDKMQKCMELLLDYGKIEWQGTLRKTFEQYFHPEIIDKSSEEMFRMIGEDKIVDLFQFSTQLGQSVVKKAKPQNLLELVSLNSLMRLVSDSEEQPIDIFIRFKNNISLWYQEMREFGLNEDEIKVFEKHLLPLNGVADSQESVMMMAMDENISGFNVVESNYLRKSIAKKNEELQKEVKDKLYTAGEKTGSRRIVIDYLWHQITRQLGYSFSVPHTLAYTLMSLVEANMSMNYQSLYWQTSCLTVNSGSLEVDDDAKKKTTNYGKVAEAIGKLKSKGVKVSQPLINKAEFGFIPDAENDRIIFSLKGIVGVGDDVAHAILENRPYSSFADFCERMYDDKSRILGKKEDGTDDIGSLVKKTHVIKLIKAGAFNEFNEPRKIMLEFLSRETETKQTLNMQNMRSIISLGLLESKEYNKYLHFYNFKNHITKNVVRTEETPIGKRTLKDKILGLDKEATEFYFSREELSQKSIVSVNGLNIEISEKKFIKEYDSIMAEFKKIIVTPEFIKMYNRAAIKKTWLKYAQGSVAKWEMDSISYYENEHELDKVNKEKYNIVSFFDLDAEPVVFGYNEFKGKKFPKQKVFTIVGTVLDRNKDKKLITILTPDGVVTAKTYSGAFSHYDKQISKTVGEKKEVVEKSWFTRGNLVLLNGFRRDDQFILKTYKIKGEEIQHTVNLITGVEKNGDLTLQDERARV